MTNPFHGLSNIILRLRYPVALPEEIATDIGVPISNVLTFDEFVRKLTNLSSRPERLKRFMPRDLAEAAFEKAQRKEIFGSSQDAEEDKDVKSQQRQQQEKSLPMKQE